MLLPILITGAVGIALYATRGEATSVEPGRRYLIGAEQAGVVSPTEIDAAKLALQGLGFRDVVYEKTEATDDGRRIAWFKGTWSGQPTPIRADNPVHVYEVLF